MSRAPITGEKRRDVAGIIAGVTCLLLLFTQAALAGRTEFFILWGIQGNWDGSLRIENGQFVNVEPYSFEPQYGSDEMLVVSEMEASWRSGTGGMVDGVHVTAQTSDETMLHLRTSSHNADLRMADFSRKRDRRLDVQGDQRLVIIGIGDPARGPKLPRPIPLPQAYTPPVPQNAVRLPHPLPKEKPITVRLSERPAGELQLRRFSGGDGLLYLQLRAPGGSISNNARILCGDELIAQKTVDGPVWLSLRPRIGRMEIEVRYPDAGGAVETRRLTTATTLIETRGANLYVNGEPFLVKGSLPKNLTEDDAAYLKSLCANTIRIRAKNLDYLDRWGFLGIVSMGRQWGKNKAGKLPQRAETDAEFFQTLDRVFDGYIEAALPVVKHPRTLVIQHTNEQVFGADRWAGRLGRRKFDRLDYLLARCYNVARPLEPMIPQGYSNCALGYRLPEFMDVYMHNTYLEKDRNWPPIEQFMEYQGCDDRPFINTEFGANVYMPQAYRGGPNSPVLEKIHEWNYYQRWQNYMEAGTIGGTNYCFYDYPQSKDWREKGFTNFGVMTADGKPKLACWALWHLWRDFAVEPAPDDDALTLRITWLRDYYARNVTLTISTRKRKRTLAVDEFSPHSMQTVNIPLRPSATFRWHIDYTTHRGLTMQACGAYPSSAERDEFLRRLQSRDTYPFLSKLLDAEVLTANGSDDATALQDMTRQDGVVTVAFRKPDGIIYVTAFARGRDDGYRDGVDLEVGFEGSVQRVDELTGEPTGEAVEVERREAALVIRDVRGPYVPKGYMRRSQKPVALPVFRIAAPHE